MLANSGQLWFYHAPSKRGQEGKKDAPVASQVPGLAALDPLDQEAWEREVGVKYVRVLLGLGVLLQWENLKYCYIYQEPEKSKGNGFQLYQVGKARWQKKFTGFHCTCMYLLPD